MKAHKQKFAHRCLLVQLKPRSHRRTELKLIEFASLVRFGYVNGVLRVFAVDIILWKSFSWRHITLRL